MGTKIKIIVAATVVLIAILCVPVLTHYRAKATLERYRQELTARGEKLSVAGAAPIVSADDAAEARDMGAIIQMLGYSPRFSNNPPAMPIVASGRAVVVWKESAMPNDSVSNVWPALQAMVADHREDLATLRAALKKPVGELMLDYHQGFSLLLPHLAPAKSAAIWLSMDAAAKLHEGDTSNAFEDLAALPRMTRMFEREPITISQLVRIAIAQIGVEAAWEGLQSTNCTDAELAELQDAWSSTHFMDTMDSAISMERAIVQISFSEARKSRENYTSMTAANGANASVGQFLANPSDGWRAFSREYPRYWAWKWRISYDEELYYLQTCLATIEAVRAMKTNGAFVPQLKKLDDDFAKLDKQYGKVQEQFAFANLAGGHRTWVIRAADMEMEKGLVVTAIALKRYELREGKYPARLEDLVPVYLSEAPKDFMDGKPLRYRANADGTFLLYSVGEDGEDNGGDVTSAEKPGKLEKHWLKGRDAVWPMPATEAEAKDYVEKTMAASAKPYAIRVPLKR